MDKEFFGGDNIDETNRSATNDILKIVEENETMIIKN